MTYLVGSFTSSPRHPTNGLRVVLGIPHPAVNTRDVALYRPFRNALQTSSLVGLPTLMWRLMGRRVQEGAHDSVRSPLRYRCRLEADYSPVLLLALTSLFIDNQLENARAALDLYRSNSGEWENVVSTGRWPSEIPPDTFSRCYN